MRHRLKNRSLGRTRAPRRRLLGALTSGLLKSGTIVTTEAKSKELRGWLEPLINEAQKELTLARRRSLLAKLESSGDLERLQRVAKTAEGRHGGYLRLTRLPQTRSDGATSVKIEFA